MVQTVMYPVKTAPIVSTTADVSAGDTNIPVTDVSGFLTAPNIITIKSGSATWERCRYTSVVVTSAPAGYLVVERSGSSHGSSSGGSALPWSAGAKVFHSVSELHLNTIKGNIEDHETRIAGHVSSVANPHAVTAIQTGAATGTVEARVFGTNPIYVDKDAAGATEDGLTWETAYRTIQAAIDSLPAVINHQTDIVVRKGSTPYSESPVISRVVGAGSLLIRGEYYWSGVCSAGGLGTFKLDAADTHYADRALISNGDTLHALKYSGAVRSTKPTDGRVIAANVTGFSADSVTTAHPGPGVTFGTTWAYTVVKTVITGNITVTGRSTTVTIAGLRVDGDNMPVKVSDGPAATVTDCVINVTGGGGGTAGVYVIDQSYCNLQQIGIAVASGYTGFGVYCVAMSRTEFNNCQVYSAANLEAGVHVGSNSYAGISYSFCPAGKRGIWAAQNSSIKGYTTFEASGCTSPRVPATSTDGAHIQ